MAKQVCRRQSVWPEAANTIQGACTQHVENAQPVAWETAPRPSGAAAAKAEAKDKIDEAAGKLGVDAPPVSMEAIDQAAELTKGKVGEAGAAVDDKVKAAVGPAQ